MPALSHGAGKGFQLFSLRGHKRRLLKGGGRGVKNLGMFFVNRQQRGRERGGHKIGKLGRRHLWITPIDYDA